MRDILQLGSLIASALLFVTAPALALVPSIATPSPEPEVPEQIIAATRDAGEDERIAERISGIFAELPSYSTVTVEVNEGVVTLTGEVPDPAVIDRAGKIASRVSGVVTVRNRLERDLSVQENLSVLGQSWDLVKNLLKALPLILVALAVAVLIGGFGYLITSFRALWSRIAPNPFLSELVRSAIRFVFVVGGIVMALDMLGAGTLMGAVLGGAGVIGIALGFAMRDTIENYVASLMLSIRQPFRANDWVLIDQYEGRVIRLTSRATILMTLDGNHLRIPNAQVFKAVILNYTRNPQRRFDFILGVDADDDPRVAMQIGIDTLSGLPFVLAEPEAQARIEGVGDSNVQIRFLGWIDQSQADWYKSRSLGIAAVKEALEKAGFALPEPIYRLRVDARSEPLPIGSAATVVEAGPERAATAPQPVKIEQDVRPESEIAQMVEKERRSDKGRTKDLLDPNRPVE